MGVLQIVTVSGSGLVQPKMAGVIGFGLMDAVDGDSYSVWPLTRLTRSFVDRESDQVRLQLQGLASDSFDSLIFKIKLIISV